MRKKRKRRMRKKRKRRMRKKRKRGRLKRKKKKRKKKKKRRRRKKVWLNNYIQLILPYKRRCRVRHFKCSPFIE